MEEREIGKITHYFGHLSVAIIELSDALKVGDKIRVKEHAVDFVQDVDSMQIEHSAVSEAARGAHVGIKVSQKVHPNARVYKVIG